MLDGWERQTRWKISYVDSWCGFSNIPLSFCPEPRNWPRERDEGIFALGRFAKRTGARCTKTVWRSRRLGVNWRTRSFLVHYGASIFDRDRTNFSAFSHLKKIQIFFSFWISTHKIPILTHPAQIFYSFPIPKFSFCDKKSPSRLRRHRIRFFRRPGKKWRRNREKRLR